MNIATQCVGMIAAMIVIVKNNGVIQVDFGTADKPDWQDFKIRFILGGDGAFLDECVGGWGVSVRRIVCLLSWFGNSDENKYKEKILRAHVQCLTHVRRQTDGIHLWDLGSGICKKRLKSAEDVAAEDELDTALAKAPKKLCTRAGPSARLFFPPPPRTSSPAYAPLASR